MMDVTQTFARPGIARSEAESGGSILRPMDRDQPVNSLPAAQDMDEDYWTTPDGT